MTWGKQHIEVDDSGYSFPYLEEYLKPKYYVFFWEFKADDDPDWEYWLQTKHVLSDVRDALEAIDWAQTHAHGRQVATFVSFYENHADGGLDNLVKVHGTIPEGRLLEEDDIFEWTSYPISWPRGVIITVEDIAVVDQQLMERDFPPDLARLLDHRFSAALDIANDWLTQPTAEHFHQLLIACYFGVLRDYVQVLDRDSALGPCEEAETLFLALICESVEDIEMTTTAALAALDNAEGDVSAAHVLGLTLAMNYLGDPLSARVSTFLAEHPMPKAWKKAYAHYLDNDPEVFFQLLWEARKQYSMADTSLLMLLIPWEIFTLCVLRLKKNLSVAGINQPEFQAYLAILEELDIGNLVPAWQQELKAAIMQHYDA